MVSAKNKPERRITGRTFLIILVVGVIVGVALVVGSIYLNGAPTGTASLTGTLFVSSAGSFTPGDLQSYVSATYNVTLSAVSGNGTMRLSILDNGTDILQQHGFIVSNFVLSPNNLTMVFSGVSVNLGWVNNSTVWKALNETYIGAAGPSAPASQLRGSISPNDFPGVPSGYYVILSLSITSQPSNNIPFVVGPQWPWESTPHALSAVPWAM
ncbi:MAG: hypothetical protein ABSA72_01080 [Nitrososphaerales archaeon]